MTLPIQPDFTGKVAVVTGGAGVLCSEFCLALSQCGAKVAVLGRKFSRAEQVASRIREAGGEALAVSCDVTQPETVEQAHDRILSALGPCDLLINGAGGNDPAATTSNEYMDPDLAPAAGPSDFFSLTERAFEKVLSVNLTGVLTATRVFSPDMLAKKSGSILNISSMSAFTPLTKIPAYSAAKSGVSNLTQWLAVHFSKTGIRCNAIAPGFFSTDQNKTLLWNADGSPTARTGKILAATPMGRFGVPEELTASVLFLLDERCSGFINGVVLPIDGGFNAYHGV